MENSGKDKNIEIRDFSIISSAVIKNIADFLLNKISPRAKQILTLRFGLNGNEPKPLSAIGAKLNITRERVRQIEVDSLKKMKKMEKPKEHQMIEKKALEIINSYGGFCEKRKLKEKIKPGLTDSERRCLMIILNSSQNLKFEKADKQLEAYWHISKETNREIIAGFSIEIFNFLRNKKNPIKFADILKFAENLDKTFFQGDLGKKRLRMILSLNKNLQRNILEEWGLKKWNLISGKGSREKAFLVLKKYSEPMHFRILTAKINEHYNEKPTLAQTVHNELIKDDRFVQVGKGTYGLAEWGLMQGTVKDVIIKLLEEKEKAMRSEIITFVLSQKKVKETTIAVNLANQKIFKRDKEGNYFLI